MNRFRSVGFGGIVLSILGVLAFSNSVCRLSLAADAAEAAGEANAAKNLPGTTYITRVDWIAPDGRLIAVPSAGDKHPSTATLKMKDNTIRCPLQEGDTTFIISFPKTSPLDHFRFINENAGVQGEMKIAVSNDQLPARSPKWTHVSGKTSFSSKRLFNLSMVGVEARYVKLSFHVEKGGHVASLDQAGSAPLEKFANR